METFIKAVKSFPILDVLGPRIWANQITGFLNVYHLMNEVCDESDFFLQINIKDLSNYVFLFEVSGQSGGNTNIYRYDVLSANNYEHIQYIIVM